MRPVPDLRPTGRRRWLRELAARAARPLLAPRPTGTRAGTRQGGRAPSGPSHAEAWWRTPLAGPEAPARLLLPAPGTESAARSGRRAGPVARRPVPASRERRAAPGGEPPAPGREAGAGLERRPESRATQPPPHEPRTAELPAGEGPATAPAAGLSRPTLGWEAHPGAPRAPGVADLDSPVPLRPPPERGIEAAGSAETDLGRLAERMRRILAAEARRHGIDV